MGAWGFSPWESDTGADWFSGLLSTGKLVEQVQGTLELDVEEHFLVMWAAVYVVECFALPFLWPHDDLTSVLEEAGAVLARALDDAPEVRDSEAFSELVRGKLATLRARLAEDRSAPG